MKILTCPNEVTELYKVGCYESKIAGAMVDNIIFAARLSRCRKEENHSSVVRVMFLGTTIVVPVYLVHPLRWWGFASPAKLVPCLAPPLVTQVRLVRPKSGHLPLLVGEDSLITPVIVCAIPCVTSLRCFLKVAHPPAHVK
jgi:hypothetical protein